MRPTALMFVLALSAGACATSQDGPKDLGGNGKDFSVGDTDMAMQLPGDMAMPYVPRDFSMGPVDLLNCSCGAAPGPYCKGNEVVTSTGAGVCGDAGCMWQTSSSSCGTMGCYAGACVTGTPSFLGNTAAFTSSGGATVQLGKTDNSMQPGSAPSSDTVSVITQTYPHGASKPPVIYWDTTGTFSAPQTVPMLFDKAQGNNDQWYGILPKQSAGTTTYFYLRADGWDGATSLYDPTNYVHLDFTWQ